MTQPHLIWAACALHLPTAIREIMKTHQTIDIRIIENKHPDPIRKCINGHALARYAIYEI